MVIENNKQHGAVSLFVVVFAAMLITIVTVSFVRNMVVDQQQATIVDLSQSAYDSAQVGVEDAKRALLYYQSVCAPGGDADDCDDIKQLMNSTDCNVSVGILDSVTQTDNEVKVRTNSEDNKLDQAYTCVITKLNTDDYIGTLTQDSSKFIPLVGVSTFDTIKIEWFNHKDLQGLPTASVYAPPFSAGTPLISQANWISATNPNRPPIMRAQLIQFSNVDGFTLNELDNNGPNATNNTLFLYPTNIINSVKNFASDVRRSSKNIVQVTCNTSLLVMPYSCSATITLPAAINSGDRIAYLNLTTIYRKSNYRVTLLNAGTAIQFHAVQPEVDSTGRANDLFRRVKSRIEMADVTFPYPSKAVDLTGNLCKDFRVSDTAADYQTFCTP